MRTATALIACFAALAALAPHPSAGQDAPDVSEIVRGVDRLYRSRTSRGELEMSIVTENWQRTLRMVFASEGLEKTFIHITYPKKEEGIATLRMGSEMWNYFPRIDKVMKVPPSMMMGSWMGSDFTNDDLVKESSMLRDYDYRLISPPGADPGLYHVELTPRKDIPIVWGKIILVVRKDDHIPVREEYFDEKGNMVRVMDFREIMDFGGRSIPSVIELTPLNREGRKTVIRYIDIRFDVELGDEVFTLRNLRRRR
jgi:outer membrane lipoprotein-sorting protein